MSQTADCKSMLISAEQRNNSWGEKLIALDIVLETMEIFLDCDSIVEILKEVKAYYLRKEYKEIDTKLRMVDYLNNKLEFYQFNN
jgi:hypothetical protein